MDAIARMGVIFLSKRRLHAENLRPYGLTLKQLFLLQWARAEGRLSPSEAARLLFCDRPTATVIVGNCVKKGWLSRRRSKEDGRAIVLELSGEGRALLELVEAEGRLELGIGDPLDALGAGEREAFEASLKKVYRRANELFGKGA
jgi:DNA-binding MarR family transcriptional regulator